jgi:hypothetical protein
MRHRNLAAFVLPLALAGASPAMAQAPDAPHDLAANAALKYWQAFALMPPLDADQEKLLAEWNKVPLDAAALKLIAASGESRLYLHRGAKIPRCDWSLDYEDGMGLLLPYLAKARDLARLTALHARHEFEQGHWESGADDATDILALARHVGSEPTMLCILVRYLIESTAIDLLAPHLPELRAVSPRIVSSYEALPAGATFEQAYLTMEKRYAIGWLARRLREAEARKPGGWRDAWNAAFVEEEGRDFAKTIGSGEQAIKMVEDLLPVCDQLARLVALPREEFEAQYPAFKAKTKAAHPLAGLILTAPDRVLATAHRNQARMAMLKAAMAIVEGGPDRLKGIKDPFGDGPFEYRALDGGFELKSKLLFQGQPVTLIVGRARKG